MDTSLIINSTTTAGKKAAKAISNINPEKDNTILKTFAQKFNALSTNIYADATRVNKMSVNEEGGGSTTTPTIVIDDWHFAKPDNYSVIDIEGGKRIIIARNPQTDEVLQWIDVTLG